jgi:hypothetical protein
MSAWSVALSLIVVIGVAGCRQGTALPPREAAPAETVAHPPTAEASTSAPVPSTSAPPPTVTVDPQPPPPVTSTSKPQPPPSPEGKPIASFAVYALSRGKGVPPEAREALRRVEALAEESRKRGVKVTVTTTRIGIEGETRVCFIYEDPKEGARDYERARDLVKDVDLVNLKVESCGEAANKEEEKKS